MTIAYKNSRLHMEGVALEDVAKKFGTPLYCYSQGMIEDNFRAYHKALSLVTDNFTICYACKANSNQAVLRVLQRQGAGADIVSGGELARALAAKIPPSRIVYSGVGKSDDEIAYALKSNIFQINVESEQELLSISRIAKRLKKTVNISIRVNPDVDAKTHAKITTGKKENKFGIDLADAPALYRRALKLPGINACGVAVHIGSQLTALGPFRRAYARVAKLVTQLRKQGNNITRVDLGGGLGITYRDETPPDLNFYAAIIREIIVPLNVHIVLEPGRYIVGNAGVLLSRVVSVKQGHAKKFLILDAAMNDLIRPALYDAYHAVRPLKQGGRKKVIYDIVGPVCETGDTFHVNEKLPELKAGDLVAIMTAGAYGAVMSSNYNTRPLAGEALVSGRKYARARKPQTLDDLVKADTVPGWIA